MSLDSINKAILRLLQEDAKQSNTAIARKVGISSPAVSERIKKLEDMGIIKGYKTLVASEQLGYNLRAIITLKAFMGKLKPFLKKVKSYDEIINCYRVTGDENIVMEIILRDQQHLEALIDELITYGETKTQIVLSQVIDHKLVKPV